VKRLLTRAEYESLIKSVPKDVCLLCDASQQVILGESPLWYWTANIAPYWKYHTMFIPKQHKEDMDELTTEEFDDFRELYRVVKNHLRGLRLSHEDGRPVDQFVLMARIREEGVSDGSTYPKPKHLHLHYSPDREGSERIVLDARAHEVHILSLALPGMV